MSYVWQSSNWPQWRWDTAALITPLAALRRKEGHLQCLCESIARTDRFNLAAQLLTNETIATSAIENITLVPDEVRAAVD